MTPLCINDCHQPPFYDKMVSKAATISNISVNNANRSSLRARQIHSYPQFSIWFLYENTDGHGNTTKPAAWRNSCVTLAWCWSTLSHTYAPYTPGYVSAVPCTFANSASPVACAKTTINLLLLVAQENKI